MSVTLLPPSPHHITIRPSTQKCFSFEDEVLYFGINFLLSVTKGHLDLWQSGAFFVVGGERKLALGLPIQSAQTEEGRDERAVMTLSPGQYVHSLIMLL